MKDTINAVELYKAPESKKAIMERHRAVMKEDAGKAAQHWVSLDPLILGFLQEL